MGYFPMQIDLREQKILFIGNGAQIADKIDKMKPFGGTTIHRSSLQPEDLDAQTALVIAGDLPPGEGARISALCRERRIPVNIVDDPENSTFFFPALVTRGDVTVSVSTGGKAPACAALLARKIGSTLPEETEQIIERLHILRKQLYAAYPKEEARHLLWEAVERAFSGGAER